MRLVLRGQILVDLDLTGESNKKELPPLPRVARKKKVSPEMCCGRTKESIRPGTFERFINQCTKEKGHGASCHLFETK